MEVIYRQPKRKLSRKIQKQLAGIIADVARQNMVTEAQCRKEMQEALDVAWPTMRVQGTWGNEKPSLELFMAVIAGRITIEDIQQEKEVERQVQFFKRHEKMES